MEAMSQSPSSTPADQHEASDQSEDLPMDDSLLFLDSLNDLKNIRSHLYSAAEYFELSYINDDQKQIVIGKLKDYTVKALANTVDHLGSVSYKVKDLVSEDVDEISLAEFRMSCVEQRLRMCQESVDKEGLYEQSLLIKAPRYHKHYMLQSGETARKSDAQPTSQWQAVHIHKEVNNRNQLKTGVCATSNGQPSITGSVKSSSMFPTPQKTQSVSPVRKVYSPPPSPRNTKMVSSEEGTTSPIQSSTTITRNRSSTNRSAAFKFSKQHSLDSKDFAHLHMSTERNNQKDSDRNTVKGRGFLKSLLTRRKSSADDLLYRYLDEY